MTNDLDERHHPVDPLAEEQCRDEAERECLIYLLLSALFQIQGTADDAAEGTSPDALEGAPRAKERAAMLRLHELGGGARRDAGAGRHEAEQRRLVKKLAGRGYARKVLLQRLSVKESPVAFFDPLSKSPKIPDVCWDDDLESALRNLLHVIKGAAYYLGTTDRVEARIRRDFSKMIAQETDRLAFLVESLLEQRHNSAR